MHLKYINKFYHVSIHLVFFTLDPWYFTHVKKSGWNSEEFFSEHTEHHKSVLMYSNFCTCCQKHVIVQSNRIGNQDTMTHSRKYIGIVTLKRNVQLSHLLIMLKGLRVPYFNEPLTMHGSLSINVFSFYPSNHNPTISNLKRECSIEFVSLLFQCLICLM